MGIILSFSRCVGCNLKNKARWIFTSVWKLFTAILQGVTCKLGALHCLLLYSLLKSLEYFDRRCRVYILGDHRLKYWAKGRDSDTLFPFFPCLLKGKYSSTISFLREKDFRQRVLNPDVCYGSERKLLFIHPCYACYCISHGAIGYWRVEITEVKVLVWFMILYLTGTCR